jgi:hypothetical protein
MQLSADLREFIGLLNSRDVEYVIVGAHSLAYHGRPCYTGDLDILVRSSPTNASKVAAVLRDCSCRWSDPQRRSIPQRTSTKKNVAMRGMTQSRALTL